MLLSLCFKWIVKWNAILVCLIYIFKCINYRYRQVLHFVLQRNYWVKIKASKESKSLEAHSFLFNYRNNLCDELAFIFMLWRSFKINITEYTCQRQIIVNNVHPNTRERFWINFNNVFDLQKHITQILIKHNISDKVRIVRYWCT